MAEKISGTSAKGVRKRQLSVQEIREALAELDQARVEMDAVLVNLDAKRIVEIEFDGVGNAHRAALALGGYCSAISGAITDPRCNKVYADPPKKKTRS